MKNEIGRVYKEIIEEVSKLIEEDSASIGLNASQIHDLKVSWSQKLLEMTAYHQPTYSNNRHNFFGRQSTFSDNLADRRQQESFFIRQGHHKRMIDDRLDRGTENHFDRNNSEAKSYELNHFEINKFDRNNHQINNLQQNSYERTKLDQNNSFNLDNLRTLDPRSNLYRNLNHSELKKNSLNNSLNSSTSSSLASSVNSSISSFHSSNTPPLLKMSYNTPQIHSQQYNTPSINNHQYNSPILNSSFTNRFEGRSPTISNDNNSFLGISAHQNSPNSNHQRMIFGNIETRDGRTMSKEDYIKLLSDNMYPKSGCKSQDENIISRNNSEIKNYGQNQHRTNFNDSNQATFDQNSTSSNLPTLSRNNASSNQTNHFQKTQNTNSSSSDSDPEIYRNESASNESSEYLSESDHDIDKLLEAANPNYMMCLYVKVDKNKFKWRVKLKQGFLNIGKTEYAFDNAHGDLTWC